MNIYSKGLFSSTPKWIYYQEFYFDGRPKFEVEIADTYYHGNSKEYWRFKVLKSQGKFNRGNKNGRWKYYYQKSGELYEEGIYVKGKKQGKWITYWKNEKERAVRLFSDGIAFGESVEKDSLGGLQVKNTCLEGNPNGQYESFFFNRNKIESYFCKNGKKLGEYSSFFPNGKLKVRGEYNEQHKKTGNWREYYESGLLLSFEIFENGLWNDSITYWSSSGKLLKSGKFDLGKGNLIEYDSIGGVVSKTSFLHGLKEGSQISFYSNGKIKRDKIFKKDTAISSTTWWPSPPKSIQQVAESGRYSGGKKSGIWTRYSETGILLEKLAYNDGMLDGVSQYYHETTGKLIRTQIYYKGMAKKAYLGSDVLPIQKPGS